MKRPIRVLYLENAIGWGGAAICLKLMAQHINKTNYYPIITAPHNNAEYLTYGQVADWRWIPDKKINKEAVARALHSFLSRMGLSGRKSNRFSAIVSSAVDYIFNIIPYTVRLYILAKKHGVKLVHLNNEPVCNMSGLLVARLLGVPCISHVRGPASWDSWVSRRLYRNVDYFIAVAEWVKKEVMKLGVPEDKIQAIGDGRIMGEFSRAFDSDDTRKSLGLKSGQLSIGIVGLLIPWKGHRVFIEAARIIGGRCPECRWLIIGKAPECHKNYEQELRQLVSESGMKNVVFAGHRDDIADVMRTLDIVVHASIEPDPYPNVVIEGMAAGRAVIASRLGGPIEMIADNQNGMLVDPGNPQLLAEGICSLLENRELRLRLGREAKKTAIEKWSIDNHIKKIQAVYEMILGQRNA